MEIRRLQRGDRRDEFSCGRAEVDLFLHKFAGQHEKKKISATFVAVEGNSVIGYVTICPSTMKTPDIPADSSRGLPAKGDIPVLLVARLGVDKERQKQGIGPALLRRALEQALLQSRELGCLGVLAHAYDERISFYSKYGFVELALASPMDTRAMFLSLGSLEDALG